jgi:hypothetical protein
MAKVKSTAFSFKLHTTKYELDVARFMKYVDTAVVEILDAIALMVCKLALKRTPVANVGTSGYIGGRAAASWLPAIEGLGGTGEIPAPFDPFQEMVGREEGIFVRRKGRGRSWVSIGSKTPYMARLEAGYSGQAPNGFLGRAMRDAQRKMDRVIPALIGGRMSVKNLVKRWRSIS